MKVRHLLFPLTITTIFTSSCNLNIDDQYLVRAVPFDFREATVYVTGSPMQKLYPLNGWQQLVFLSANGKRQVGALIRDASRAAESHMKSNNVEKDIRTAVDQMLAAGWIRLSSQPVDLPQELIRTISER